MSERILNITEESWQKLSVQARELLGVPVDSIEASITATPESRRRALYYLGTMVDNLLSAIPDELKSKVFASTSSLEIPSQSDLILQPILVQRLFRSLDMLVDKKKLNPEQLQHYQQIGELIDSVIHLAAKDILGLGRKESDVSQNLMKLSLNQAGRLIALLGPALTAAYATINISKLTTTANAKPAAAESSVKSADLELENAGAKGVFQTGFGWFVRGLTVVVGVPAYCFVQYVVKPALKYVIIPVVKTAIGLWDKLRGNKEKKEESEDNAESFKWNRKDKRGVDLFDRMFGRLGNLLANLFDGFDFDISGFSEGILGRQRARASIKSNDPSFLERMSVAEVHVISGTHGRLTHLSSFLRRSRDPRAPEVFKQLFREKIFTKPLTESDLTPGRTHISIKVAPGFQILPLPQGYQVSGLRLIGPGKKIATEPVVVMECAFGSAYIEIPMGYRYLTYQVEAGEYKCGTDVVKTLQNMIPKVKPYLGVEGDAVSEAVSFFPIPQDELAELLYQIQINRKYGYTMDPFIHRILRIAHGSLCEAISGLRMGTCDPFAFFTSSVFLKNDLPAVVIGGLYVDESGQGFDRKAGHAQSCRMTPSGAVTYDLTQKAQKLSDEIVDSVSWKDKKRILEMLPPMKAEELHHFLRALRHELDNVESGSGYLLSLFRKLFRTKIKNPSLEDGFKDVESKYRSVVIATTQKISLEKYIARGRRLGEVADVYEFFERNPELETLTKDDKALLPKSLSDLQSSCLRDKVLQFTRECLLDRSLPREARKELIEWIKNHTSRTGKGGGTPIRNLTVDEVCFLFEGAGLRSLNNENLIEFFMRTVCFASVDIKLSTDQAKKLATVVRGFTIEISRRKLTVQNDFPAVLDHIAILGEQLAVSNSHADAAQAFQIMAALDDEHFINHSFAVAYGSHACTDSRTRYLAFVRRIKAGLGFESVGSALNIRRAELLASCISSHYLYKERVGSSILLDLWKETLQFFSDLGLSAANRINADRLYQSLFIAAAKDKHCINFPLERSPGSFLLARMSSLPSVWEYRLAEVFCKYGIYSEAKLQAGWPTVAESIVIDHFWSLANISRNSILTLGVKDGIKDSRFEVCKSDTLIEQYIKQDRRLEAVAKYNSLQGRNQCWADRAFQIMKADYPDQWKRWDMFSEQFSIDVDRASHIWNSFCQGLLGISFEKLSPDSVYRALIWLTAERTSDPIFEEKLAKITAAREAATIEEFKNETLGLFRPAAEAGKVLADLSAEAKIAALLLGAFDHSGSIFHTFNTAAALRFEVVSVTSSSAGIAVAEQWGVCNSLYQRLLVTRSDGKGKTGLAKAWNSIFKLSSSTEGILEDVLSEYLRRTESSGAVTRETLPRYIYHRSGRTIVNSTGGDFRELREYAEGDDIKRIDWRSSAKSERLLVRLNEEEENRPLTLVCDLEELAQNYSTWTYPLLRQIGRWDIRDYYQRKRNIDFEKQNLVKNIPREIKDLFKFLNLAANSGRSVDLVLYGRTQLTTIEGVVRKSPDNSCCIVDTATAARGLECALRTAAEVLTLEQRIYADKRFPGVDLFEARDLPLKRGRTYVFLLNQKNIVPSAGTMKAVKEKGIGVFRLKPVEQLVAKSEPKAEALSDQDLSAEDQLEDDGY